MELTKAGAGRAGGGGWSGPTAVEQAVGRQRRTGLGEPQAPVSGITQVHGTHSCHQGPLCTVFVLKEHMVCEGRRQARISSWLEPGAEKGGKGVTVDLKFVDLCGAEGYVLHWSMDGDIEDQGHETCALG